MIAELSPGATLAGYRIESVIGRGGMGVVYLAEDLRLSRKVAIKLIVPGLSSDARFRERFLREAELTASLDHPHVLPVYGAGETDGLLWTAMRYVEGEDLDTLLAREGPLAPERAVELARQIGEALDAAHARGLVHRDVKPANVLVAPVASGEHCYLTDFGLARASQDEALAPTGAHLSGTVAYAAPERIAGRFVDGRADVYSLGCVLFECLAGEPPFARRRPSATVAAHMDEQPPSVWQLRPELPSDFDDIVAKALAKEPGERYASCGELSQAARAALAPTEPWWRSRPAIAAAAMVVVAALAAALAVAFTRGGAEPAAAEGPVADSPLPLVGDSLVRLDAATGEIVATVTLDGNPAPFGFGVAGDDRYVWVGDDNGTVSRIDAITNEVSATFDVPGGEQVWDLTAAGGDIWVTTESGAIMRSRGDAGALEPVELPPSQDGPPFLAGGSIWVGAGGQLLRIDPDTGDILARLDALGATEIVGEDFLWAIANSDEGPTLVRVDTNTDEITALPELPWDLLPWNVLHLAEATIGAGVGEGSVWMGNVGDGATTLRLDEMTGRLQGRFPGPGVTPGPGAVWVGGPKPRADWVEGTIHWVADPPAGCCGLGDGLSRVDLTTGDVRTIDVGGTPFGLAIAGDSVWVVVDVQ